MRWVSEAPRGSLVGDWGSETRSERRVPLLSVGRSNNLVCGLIGSQCYWLTVGLASHTILKRGFRSIYVSDIDYCRSTFSHDIIACVGFIRLVSWGREGRSVFSKLKWLLFHRFWDLSTKIIGNTIRNDSKRSQSEARTTKLYWETMSFVKSAVRTKKFHRWWMNVQRGTSPVAQKAARFVKWPRKGLLLFARFRIYFRERREKYLNENFRI